MTTPTQAPAMTDAEIADKIERQLPVKRDEETFYVWAGYSEDWNAIIAALRAQPAPVDTKSASTIPASHNSGERLPNSDAAKVGADTAPKPSDTAAVKDHHIAQLRHAYKQLKAGTVVNQSEFADGLLSPVIQALEKTNAPSAPGDAETIARKHGWFKLSRGWYHPFGEQYWGFVGYPVCYATAEELCAAEGLEALPEARDNEIQSSDGGVEGHANAGERRSEETVLGNRPAVGRLSSAPNTKTGRGSGAGVESCPSDAIAAEREAFIDAHCKYLDLTEDFDAWGRPKFRHSHIEAIWDGWKKRALRTATPPAQSIRAAVVEDAPEWLWYGEVDGKPVVTFGRWPKHGARWRYKWAHIQPTEHDHPVRPFAFAVKRPSENGEDQWRLLRDESAARDAAAQLDGEYEGLYRVGDRRSVSEQQALVYKRAWDTYVEKSMDSTLSTFDCIKAVVDVALAQSPATASREDGR